MAKGAIFYASGEGRGQKQNITIWGVFLVPRSWFLVLGWGGLRLESRVEVITNYERETGGRTNF